uniref:Zinc-finger domain-containing protein n=1 Tax=Compsopogon caeruleus TaxID=31354 RepID=A0A7S1XF76_9RHOD|mmetsp:Transcript_2788/g.5133  ORF Transcript_2788/g.5133 Transcript_2788/m.5133 type:complete len:484 (+) Transcript_2788:223-1674(+)
MEEIGRTSGHMMPPGWGGAGPTERGPSGRLSSHLLSGTQTSSGSQRLSTRLSQRMSSRLSSCHASGRLPSGDIALLDTWLKDFVKTKEATGSRVPSTLTLGDVSAWDLNDRKRKRNSSLQSSRGRLSACLYADTEAEIKALHPANQKDEMLTLFDPATDFLAEMMVGTFREKPPVHHAPSKGRLQAATDRVKMPSAVVTELDEPPQVTTSWVDLERNFSRARSLEPFISLNDSSFEQQFRELTMVGKKEVDRQPIPVVPISERRQSMTPEHQRRFLLAPSEAARKQISLIPSGVSRDSEQFACFDESLREVESSGDQEALSSIARGRSLSGPSSSPGIPTQSGEAPSADVSGGISGSIGVSSSHRNSTPSGAAQRKQKMKRYKSLEPSRHCHVCSRPDDSVEVMVCSRLFQGICRKVVCEKCFERYEWDFEGSRANNDWLCTHCRGECPDKACCKKYEKTNLARHWKAKLRRTNALRGDGEPM